MLLDEQQRYKLYRSVFGKGAGQRVLEDLVDFFAPFDTAFNEDARRAERHEGNQEVIFHILGSMGIMADTEKFIRAISKIPAPRPEKAQKEAENE